MQDPCAVNIQDGVEAMPITVEKVLGDVASFVAITKIEDLPFGVGLKQFAQSGVRVDVEIGLQNPLQRILII